MMTYFFVGVLKLDYPHLHSSRQHWLFYTIFVTTWWSVSSCLNVFYPEQVQVNVCMVVGFFCNYIHVIFFLRCPTNNYRCKIANIWLGFPPVDYHFFECFKPFTDISMWRHVLTNLSRTQKKTPPLRRKIWGRGIL